MRDGSTCPDTRLSKCPQNLYSLLPPLFKLLPAWPASPTESADIAEVPQEGNSHCRMPAMLSLNGGTPRPDFPGFAIHLWIMSIHYILVQ